MNADIARTKEYYQSVAESALCNCDYCCNYRIHIKSAFPKVAGYLASLGIDIEKFRVATSYPSTGIKEDHFVIELFPV